MEEPAETREEAKHSRGFGMYALWAGVVLVLYVLSVGPVAKFEIGARSPSLNIVLGYLYLPLFWAYENTPLHKPLGMYFRLWAPQEFDKNGNHI